LIDHFGDFSCTRHITEQHYATSISTEVAANKRKESLTLLEKHHWSHHFKMVK